MPDPDIDAFMKASALEGQTENLVTDYVMKILGLDICADTLVGNQLIRGVSGGQRKRVTTGEFDCWCHHCRCPMEEKQVPQRDLVTTAKGSPESIRGRDRDLSVHSGEIHCTPN